MLVLLRAVVWLEDGRVPTPGARYLQPQNVPLLRTSRPAVDSIGGILKGSYGGILGTFWDHFGRFLNSLARHTAIS